MAYVAHVTLLRNCFIQDEDNSDCVMIKSPCVSHMADIPLLVATALTALLALFTVIPVTVAEPGPFPPLSLISLFQQVLIQFVFPRL